MAGVSGSFGALCGVIESSNNSRSKLAKSISSSLLKQHDFKCHLLTSIFSHIARCKYSFISHFLFPLAGMFLGGSWGGQKVALFMYCHQGMCSDSLNISCLSHSLTACIGMLRPSPFLFPLIPHPHVVFVRVSVGVCSAWAVGGVVVMESVLRDLWAGLQDANQEV